MTEVKLRKVEIDNTEESTKNYAAIEKISFLEKDVAVLPKETNEGEVVIAIDDNAGKDKLLMTEKLVIPNTIQLIGENAFSGNYITDVVFEDASSCLLVQKDAFLGIETEVFVVPDSITIAADSGLKTKLTILNKADIDITDEHTGFKLKKTKDNDNIYDKLTEEEKEEVNNEVLLVLKILNKHDIKEDTLYYKGVELINTGFFWEVSLD